MGEELVRSPRLPLDVEINYNNNGIAQSQDFSESGIAIITDQNLTISTILTLSFYLPNTQNRLSIFGKVAWCKPVTEHLYKNGLEYWDISNEVKDEIRSYFKETSSQ